MIFKMKHSPTWQRLAAALFAARRRRGSRLALALRLLFVSLLVYLWIRVREEEGRQETGGSQTPIDLTKEWGRSYSAETPAWQAAATASAEAAAPEAAADVGDSGRMTAEAEEAVAMNAAAEPAPQPDDLTLIEGIGPKINAILQEAGIHTFAQLANAGRDEIERILQAANIRLANAETWEEQARLATASDWQGLKELQGTLKAGRRVK